MADNLLKRYMQEGGMMPMEGEAPMQEAPMQEAPAEEAPSVEGILKELIEMLKTWESKEYESDENRWQEYTNDVANLVGSYMKQ